MPHPTYERVCTGDHGARRGGANHPVRSRNHQLPGAAGDLLCHSRPHHAQPPRELTSVPQYRSIIVYHSPEQRETAVRLIEELDASGLWEDPIVTQVEPFSAFYPAEEYHELLPRNPNQPYCSLVIAPKVRCVPAEVRRAAESVSQPEPKIRSTARCR